METQKNQPPTSHRKAPSASQLSYSNSHTETTRDLANRWLDNLTRKAGGIPINCISKSHFVCPFSRSDLWYFTEKLRMRHFVTIAKLESQPSPSPVRLTSLLSVVKSQSPMSKLLLILYGPSAAIFTMTPKYSFPVSKRNPPL